MINWLADNIGTIAVTAVLAVIVVIITLKIIKDKKHGKTSCGCGCANCTMQCHKTND